jgi:Rrf2 family protein
MMSIQELAQQERIPKKFLEQVLLALKKAGILQSSRGKTGGYSLGMTPADVTLRDIIRAVDGPMMALPCLSPASPTKCADCVSLENCWLRRVMAEVDAGVAAVLEHVSLADMSRRAAQSQRRGAAAAMYHI